MRTSICVSLVLIAVATSVSGEGPRSRRVEADRCSGIRVEAATADESGPASRRSRSTSVFSAAEVKDLRVEVLLRERNAAEPVSVKLFTPRGRLYQVLDLVAVPPTEAERSARRGRSSRSTFVRLSANFPVAGTQITNFDLFGEWRAEPYLGSSETSCARPLEFEIQR